MTCLVIGASSGLGRALAERFARAGEALVLVSSDARDGDAVAADLALRYGVQARSVALDLAQETLSYGQIELALDCLPLLTGILLPAGTNRDDDEPGQQDVGFKALTRVNYSSICQLINRFLPRLDPTLPGVIVGFGSIAATRGRRRNVAYAAAKRALETYFESLRHALAGTSVVVQFYVLGYLDTNLAFGQETPLPRAAPAACAEHVFQHRRENFGRAFLPSYWEPVCLLLRSLPWFVFRRMSF